MADPDGGAPTVLIVDDEPDVADLHAHWLREEYDVRTAYGGREALDADVDDVDLVVLDRRMPDVSGDGVLNELRVRGYDGPVVMLTVADPSVGVSDAAFDAYLRKPVDEDDLLATVDSQIGATEVDDDALERYAKIRSKLALLEERYAASELEGSEQYEALRTEANRLRERLSAELSGIDDRIGPLRDANRGSG